MQLATYFVVKTFSEIFLRLSSWSLSDNGTKTFGWSLLLYGNRLISDLPQSFYSETTTISGHWVWNYIRDHQVLVTYLVWSPTALSSFAEQHKISCLPSTVAVTCLHFLISLICTFVTELRDCSLTLSFFVFPWLHWSPLDTASFQKTSPIVPGQNPFHLRKRKTRLAWVQNALFRHWGSYRWHSFSCCYKFGNIYVPILFALYLHILLQKKWRVDLFLWWNMLAIIEVVGMCYLCWLKKNNYISYDQFSD